MRTQIFRAARAAFAATVTMHTMLAQAQTPPSIPNGAAVWTLHEDSLSQVRGKDVQWDLWTFDSATQRFSEIIHGASLPAKDLLEDYDSFYAYFGQVSLLRQDPSDPLVFLSGNQSFFYSPSQGYHLIPNMGEVRTLEKFDEDHLLAVVGQSSLVLIGTDQQVTEIAPEGWLGSLNAPWSPGRKMTSVKVIPSEKSIKTLVIAGSDGQGKEWISRVSIDAASKAPPKLIDTIQLVGRIIPAQNGLPADQLKPYGFSVRSEHLWVSDTHVAFKSASADRTRAELVFLRFDTRRIDSRVSVPLFFRVLDSPGSSSIRLVSHDGELTEVDPQTGKVTSTPRFFEAAQFSTDFGLPGYVSQKAIGWPYHWMVWPRVSPFRKSAVPPAQYDEAWFLAQIEKEIARLGLPRPVPNPNVAQASELLGRTSSMHYYLYDLDESETAALKQLGLDKRSVAIAGMESKAFSWKSLAQILAQSQTRRCGEVFDGDEGGKK